MAGSADCYAFGYAFGHFHGKSRWSFQSINCILPLPVCEHRKMPGSVQNSPELFIFQKAETIPDRNGCRCSSSES
jgi:hypothetical protein